MSKIFYEKNNGRVVKFKKSLIWKSVVVVFAFITACSSVYYVSPGYSGAMVTLGNVGESSYSNGIGFKLPFISTMRKIDIRTQVMTDTTLTYTADIQTAKVAYTMTYNVAPSAVPMLYQKIGEDYCPKLISPYVMDAIKDVIGKWQAQDLVANRDKARVAILDMLKKKIDSKYIQNITFQITNLDYSDNFEAAIENKVIAAQKAQEASNNTKRIQEEADQKVISAKADAEAMAIKAEALERNQRLVDYEAVQKWDGKLPTYMLGNTTPFLNINKQ